MTTAKRPKGALRRGMLVEGRWVRTVARVSNAALVEFPADTVASNILQALSGMVPGPTWRQTDSSPGGSRWHSSVLLQGPTTDRIAVSVLESELPRYAAIVTGDTEGVDLRDLLAEIANTVAGNLKALIGPYYATGIPEPSLPGGFPHAVHRFTNGELHLEVGIYG
jgi:hypothetical protein